MRVEKDLSNSASEPDEELIGAIGGERRSSVKIEHPPHTIEGHSGLVAEGHSGHVVEGHSGHVAEDHAVVTASASKTDEMVSDEESIVDESQAKEAASEDEMRASSRMSRNTQGSEHSEGVVMAHGKRPKSSAPSATGMDPSDIVTIVVSHASLDENCPLLTDDNVRMLFVEYHFLGVPLEETETPYSLPKPTIANKPISFNFTKVFHVDYENNYEKRQYLGGMLLPYDPDNGRIRFTIVSEPLDEDDEDCSDVGAAYVSIPEILKNGRDLVNQEIPIYDINNESSCIGVLGVSVECLAALKVIERQLRTETITA